MKILHKISTATAAFIIAITLGLTGPITAFAATSPTLGAVGSYSVLGHTTVTNTGGTTMPGDLGISIGGAPTGFPPGSVGPPGTIRNAGDSLAAQNANTAAFLALSAAPNVACDGGNYVGEGVHELGGSTLTPGVYCADYFQLTGTLTLDDTNNPNGVWIFRAESQGNSSAGVGATVRFLTGTGSPCNVWWKISSSMTIGSNTTFIGNILALTSISLGTGANLNGRALAQTGEVTLDTNTITGGPACLIASSSGSSSTGANVSSTVVPRLPNTGVGSDEQNIPWNIVIMAGLFTASILFIVVRRKSKI